MDKEKPRECHDSFTHTLSACLHVVYSKSKVQARTLTHTFISSHILVENCIRTHTKQCASIKFNSQISNHGPSIWLEKSSYGSIQPKPTVIFFRKQIGFELLYHSNCTIVDDKHCHIEESNASQSPHHQCFFFLSRFIAIARAEKNVCFILMFFVLSSL